MAEVKAEKSAEIERLCRDLVIENNNRHGGVYPVWPGTVYLKEKLALVYDAGRLSGLEEAARAMCGFCVMPSHYEAARFGDIWLHALKSDPEDYRICMAAPIQAILTLAHQGKPVKGREEEKAMEAHQQRVIDEKKQLDEKIEKLNTFISSSLVFPKLPEEERKHLSDQHYFMKNYSDVLGARIAAFPQPAKEGR